MKLISGSGESGKSTFIKQLRIIKGNGFTDKNRTEFTLIIRSNLLQITRSILSAMALLYIELETQEAREDRAKVLQLLEEEVGEMHPDEIIEIDPQKVVSVSQSVINLWRDEGFKACYRRNKEYQVSVAAANYYAGANSALII